MKKRLDFELDEEEKEILEAFEKGKFVSVENPEKAKKEAIEAARNTLKKKKKFTINLSLGDIFKLKEKSENAGVSSQTLVASILHQFANK